jgi:hypothetical protein
MQTHLRGDIGHVKETELVKNCQCKPTRESQIQVYLWFLQSDTGDVTVTTADVCK